MMDKKDIIRIFVKNRKKANTIIFKCLIEGCSEVAINSHSQSTSTLKKIALNGHLIGINEKFDPDRKQFFREIGIQEASTFRGFCNKHDTEYFKEVDRIDDIALRDISEKILAEMFFRTFAYDTRRKEKEFKKTENDISDLIDKQGLIDGCFPFKEVSRLTDHRKGQKMFLEIDKPYYLKRITEMFRLRDYTKISGHIFTLKQLPLSCSTLISLDVDELCDPDKPQSSLCFCLFPHKTVSLAIFIYFKEYKNLFQKFFDEYKSLESIIFNNCEEILMAPAFYDSLSPKFKEEIKKGLRMWAFWKKRNFQDLLDVELKSPVVING